MKPILNIFIFIFRQMQLSGHRQTTMSTNSTYCIKFERLSTLSTFSIVDDRPVPSGFRLRNFAEIDCAGGGAKSFQTIFSETARLRSCVHPRNGQGEGVVSPLVYGKVR